MRHLVTILALAALGAAAGCGGGGDSTGPSGGGNAVTVRNNSFTPPATTVAAGTTVTWTWSAGSVSHNVTFDDGPASATMDAGTYTRAFTASGTYHYHCTIHGAAMSGSITVQ